MNRVLLIMTVLRLEAVLYCIVLGRGSVEAGSSSCTVLGSDRPVGQTERASRDTFTSYRFVLPHLAMVHSIGLATCGLLLLLGKCYLDLSIVIFD